MTADSHTPQIELCPLPQADGSCQYTCPTSHTTVLTSVNGPIEVRAKDELPNHATIEVIVKPGIGVGGVRETRLSTILHSTLKSLILTSQHPRTLIQIVSQIVQAEDHTSIPLLLSPLLNCAILSLLVAGVPLRTTAWCVHLAVLSPKNYNGTGSNEDTQMEDSEAEVKEVQILRNPGRKDLARCQSSHTLAFSKEGDTLLIESLECSPGSGGESADGQGWSMDEWLEIMEEAKRICIGDGVITIREALAQRKVF